MNGRKRIVGIKAGSSIFQEESCFESVAALLAPLTQQADQIFFVVSALKGETDRTIDDIAGKDREILNAALQGNPSPTSARYNNTDIAAQLVAPEGYSVQQLTTALRAHGIHTIGLQHGKEYPLIGVDNGNFLYATPDLTASQQQMPRYDAQIIVVPGFGVRNQRGEIMCTGRGSSDLTLAQFGTIFGLDEIVYWKDTGGYLRNSNDRSEGIYECISREQVELEGAKVLERRVLKTYAPEIRITDAGKISDGTIISPYQGGARAQSLYGLAAAK